MFERFTDRARRVVVQSQEEARMLAHCYVGAEHVLLGLFHAGGVGAGALESLGITGEAVRQRVEDAVGRGEVALPGRIPFTPRTKEMLELSVAESAALGHSYVGTEHLLLGLLRQGEGVAAQVLSELGADHDRAREQVVRLLEEYRRQHGDQTG